MNGCATVLIHACACCRTTLAVNVVSSNGPSGLPIAVLIAPPELAVIMVQEKWFATFAIGPTNRSNPWLIACIVSTFVVKCHLPNAPHEYCCGWPGKPFFKSSASDTSLSGSG